MPKLPIVFITSLASSETAIKAMTLGAFDYLLKPLDIARIRELVGQALEIRRLMSIPVEVPGASSEAGGRRSRFAATRSSAAARKCRKSTRRSAASPRKT